MNTFVRFKRLLRGKFLRGSSQTWTPTSLVAFVALFLSGVAYCADAVAIHEAVAKGLVSVEVSGMGASTGDAITVVVREKTSELLILKLEEGTVFSAQDSSVQNMVGARIRGLPVGGNRFQSASQIVLTDNNPHTLIVEAYCMDFHKSNPSSASVFSVSTPDCAPCEATQKRAGATY
jgi:hypothetical protein